MTQQDLFDRPPAMADAPGTAPAVEPTPERFRRDKDDPRDYAAEWEAFHAAHYDVAQWMVELAEEDARTGRVSARAIAERVRSRFRVSINNSLTASIARWLVEIRPELAGVIRLRAVKESRR